MKKNVNRINRVGTSKVPQGQEPTRANAVRKNTEALVENPSAAQPNTARADKERIFTIAAGGTEKLMGRIHTDQRSVFVTASPSPAPGAAALSGAPFLHMEDSVRAAIALLRLLAENTVSIWNTCGEKWHESQSAGINILADECAKSLLAQWTASHEETRCLGEGQPVECNSAATLHLHVEKTITLLRLLADESTDTEIREAEAAARHSGVVHEVRANGFSMLASEIIKSLRSQYEEAFEAWQTLESSTKHLAAGLASAA
jgi:hypothetical protein